MKNWLAMAVVLLAGLGPTLAFAAPISNFSWSAPTQYVDSTTIPPTDILGYKIYCGANTGGPYPYIYDVGSTVEAATQDVGTCVQGVPGTYYFVATATSTDYNAESAYSNEATRTYTAADLGKVPLPPTLLSVQ